MQKRRIFIAINIPDDVKEKLYLVSKKFEPLPARWVRKEGIHLTLSFIGHISQEELETISALLEKSILQIKPFSMNLTTMKLAPNPKRPSYIWTAVEKNETLSALYNFVKNTVKNSGVLYKKDSYGFSPHITLARITDFKYRPTKEQEGREEILNLTVNINSFEIMESFIQRGGAKYKMVKSYKLKG